MPTRKEQAEATKVRIFIAASTLFARHGYHETTVMDICRRAKVAKGTFFLYYATKDAVVAEIVRFQLRTASLDRESARARGASPLDVLHATVLSLGEQAGGNRNLTRAVLAASVDNSEVGGESDAHYTRLLTEMAQDVEDAQARGLLERKTDARAIVDVLIASYLGATLQFATSPTSKPLLEVLRPLLDASLAAFGGKRA